MKFRSTLAAGITALMLTSITAVPILGMAACEKIGVPVAKTFNERTALALTQVTAVRESAAALLTADKIKADDAENINKQADYAREAVDLAVTFHATDPTQAENRLAAAQAVVSALRTYLESR